MPTKAQSSKRTARTMRATTVRFGSDLWALLEREAERSGVSVAQYVREAALTRIAYSAGRRGEEPFGVEASAENEPTPEELSDERMADLAAAAEAVKRQANQAQRQARALVEKARTEAERRGKQAPPPEIAALRRRSKSDGRRS